MFNNFRCVVHHHRTAIFTETGTALFRLRDRPHKAGRSLEGELLTSQIFHSDKWSDKHETWNFSSCGKCYKKYIDQQGLMKYIRAAGFEWDAASLWHCSKCRGAVTSNFNSLVPVKLSSTGTENHCCALVFRSPRLVTGKAHLDPWWVDLAGKLR